jgi:hypothetical protein
MAVTTEQYTKWMAKYKTHAAIIRSGVTTKGQLGHYTRMAGRTAKPAVGQAAKQADGGKKKRTIADFKAAYDKDTIIPNRIKDGLKRMVDEWLTEQEFVRFAGVSTGDMANYREQFEAYIVPVKRDKRIWAKTPRIAAELRELV